MLFKDHLGEYLKNSYKQQDKLIKSDLPADEKLRILEETQKIRHMAIKDMGTAERRSELILGIVGYIFLGLGGFTALLLIIAILSGDLK
ncbi:MAG: hypothetical protein Q8O83_00310 [bacterium]|nr:hypothetical protein [bacterium]